MFPHYDTSELDFVQLRPHCRAEQSGQVVEQGPGNVLTIGIAGDGENVICAHKRLRHAARTTTPVRQQRLHLKNGNGA